MGVVTILGVEGRSVVVVGRYTVVVVTGRCVVVVVRYVVVVVGRGVVVVVVITFFEHLQSQSAMPVAVAKENDELSPSRSEKNPLSWPNLSGFADIAANCESFMTFMNVRLSTSIVTTFDPTVASSYIYKMTALTPGASEIGKHEKFFLLHFKKLCNDRIKRPRRMLTAKFSIQSKEAQCQNDLLLINDLELTITINVESTSHKNP